MLSSDARWASNGILKLSKLLDKRLSTTTEICLQTDKLVLTKQQMTKHAEDNNLKCITDYNNKDYYFKVN